MSKAPSPGNELYLFPVPISEGDPKSVLAPYSISILERADVLFVEKPKVSRSLLGKLGLKAVIEKAEFVEIGKTALEDEINSALMNLASGATGLLMSDSGMPCIGDPGWEVVAQAHQLGIGIKPIPGPSSFMQALMASGFSGQKFVFHGYLPIDKAKRKKVLQRLSRDLTNTGYTQIFMETPYRNHELFRSILSVVDQNIGLSISTDINGENESIETARVFEWKRMDYKLPKSPTVFVLGDFS